MIRTQRHALLRGIAATAALAVLLVGPPMLLVVFVGWPLPSTIPGLDEIHQALTIGIEDEAIVKAVALLTWLAWAQVAASITVEVVAAIRSREARALPLLPGLQAAIGKLVASAALALSSVGPAHATPGAAVEVPVQLAEVTETPPSMRLTFADNGAAAEEPPTSPTLDPAPHEPTRTPRLPTVHVHRHDSYWAIAERTLGDGLRWREIRDLNVGRTMPDGHTITSDSHDLHDGWTLLLPATAAEASAPPVGPETPVQRFAPSANGGQPGSPVEVTAEPGDNLWDLAEQHLSSALGQPASAADIGPYWLEFVAANRDRLAHPDNPDLIYPGQTFVHPGPNGAGQQPASPTASPHVDPGPTTSPPSPTPENGQSGSNAPPPHRSPEATEATPRDSSPTEGNERAPDSEQTSPSSSRPDDTTEGRRPEDGGGVSVGATVVSLLGAATTALAVGVTRAVRQRRRRRNHQSPDSTAAPSAQQELHRRLVREADEDAHDALRHALDDLAAAVAGSDYRCRPRIVQASRDHLDLLLDQAAPAALDGWQAQASGQIWVRTPEAFSSDHEPLEPADAPAATPLLVTLGQPDEGGQLYIDLEAAGVVVLTGDHEVALSVARRMTVELAHSSLLDAAQIAVVGEIGPPLDGLQHVTAWTSWDKVADNLVTWTEQTRDAVAANGWANPFVGPAIGCGTTRSCLSRWSPPNRLTTPTSSAPCWLLVMRQRRPS